MVTSLDEARSAPWRRVGQEMADLLRRERIGDVDEAQALREPGERNDRAVKALGGLVAAGHRRLRAPSLSRPGTWKVAIGIGMRSSVMS